MICITKVAFITISFTVSKVKKNHIRKDKQQRKQTHNTTFSKTVS